MENDLNRGFNLFRLLNKNILLKDYKKNNLLAPPAFAGLRFIKGEFWCQDATMLFSSAP